MAVAGRAPAAHLTAPPASRQAKDMGELSPSTIEEEHLTLERERVDEFLRRPGGAQALARLLLPDEITMELSQPGDVVLHPRCVTIDGPARPGLEASCEAFVLESIDAGVLLVERGFAHHLVNAILGRPPSLATRSLSRIERGIVAGLVALLFGRLGIPCGIRATSPCSPPQVKDALFVEVRAHVQGSDGQAWLCAGPAAVGRVWQMAGTAGPSATLRVELARTELAEADAVTACPRDLVVFDDRRACLMSEPLLVDLCYRGRVLPVSLDGSGSVRMDDASARNLSSSRASPGGSVVITAEIVRKRRSSFATVEDPAFSAVLLRIGESDWAEGVLVAHEGCLAVQITRMLRTMGAD